MGTSWWSRMTRRGSARAQQPHREPGSGVPGPTTIELTAEFRRALALLDAGQHLFLTGKAGTGKSTLIRHYLASTTRNVTVAAPTGIAALNVEGYTIHRLFGFRPHTTLEDVATATYAPSALKQIDTLIIDEASMVRADLFDMMVTALTRFGPRPGRPFGGVQIVLVGDLYQLPPVVQDAEAEFFATRYPTPYFFSADHYRPEDFPTVSLTKVFRQIGDPRLTELLNQVREGVLVDSARATLNARTITDFEPPDDEFWLTLAPTNRIVTARNRRHLEALPGEAARVHADQRGDLQGFDPPTDTVLELKVGAQVMMLTNDPRDRWVNGTLGRIAQLEQADGEIGGVLVEFRDGTRAWARPHTWEVTRPTSDGGRLRHETVGTFTQLPVKLAWAITIHKSQGQTVDRLIVDLSGGTFAGGQVYVALSRCTSMDGLVLTREVLAKDLRTDRRVLRFLRTSAQVGQPQRLCGIGICTVGQEGRMSRPRPVELAIAFDDGTALTTLVNPQRDLGTARADAGIDVDDVLLAPTLAEAWSLIGRAATGHTPAAVQVDHTLGLIDFELKRLGYVTHLPVGMDVDPALLTPAEHTALAAGTALDRARAALAAASRATEADRRGEPFGDPEEVEVDVSYLLTRTPQVPTPQPEHMPALAGVLDVSRTVGRAILGGEQIGAPVAVAGASGLAAVADQMRIAASRVHLTPTLIDRLEVLQAALGTQILPEDAGTDHRPPIWQVLVPGARVCFTGSTIDPQGRPLSRDTVEDIARSAGLAIAPNVSRTRCDVLVVAELGTQSGKARKALEFGTPIYTVAEFLTWAGQVATPR